MSRLQWFRWILAAMACASWILPAPGFTCGPPVPRMSSVPRTAGGTVVDLALDKEGRLVGQVIDNVGKPVGEQLVVVLNMLGGQRYETQTDAQGQFAIAGLRGGLFQLTSAGTSLVCRCWTHSAAPPAATERVLLVATDGVERGQKPIGDLFLSHPVLLGLIIAAAIAIPIAVHNSGDDDSAS